MTYLGADPEALDALAKAMGSAADELNRVAARVRSNLASAPWVGRHADEFRAFWRSNAEKSIGNAVHGLQQSASDLHRNAKEQRQASSADGGHTSLLGQAERALHDFNQAVGLTQFYDKMFNNKAYPELEQAGNWLEQKTAPFRHELTSAFRDFHDGDGAKWLKNVSTSDAWHDATKFGGPAIGALGALGAGIDIKHNLDNYKSDIIKGNYLGAADQVVQIGATGLKQFKPTYPIGFVVSEWDDVFHAASDIDWQHLDFPNPLEGDNWKLYPESLWYGISQVPSHFLSWL